jgi:predicted O-methyltransferase YrrM
MENMSEWVEREHRPYGWFSNQEGAFYNETVSHYPSGVLVEIGSYLGRSLSYVLETCRNLGIEVYAVDVWIGEGFVKFNFPPGTVERFQANMKRLGYEHDVHILQSDSVEAAAKFKPESVDVIMLDTIHTYERTKREIQAWLPKLKPNGPFLFHDYTDKPQPHPEYETVWNVRRAIEETLKHIEKRVGSLVLARKK